MGGECRDKEVMVYLNTSQGNGSGEDGMILADKMCDHSCYLHKAKWTLMSGAFSV